MDAGEPNEASLLHVAVVSPHRDDAAFSCGLMIASLLRAGHAVTIYNLFTVSDYAVREIGIEPLPDRVEAVSAARLREDLCAADEIRRFAACGTAPVGTLSMHDMGWLDAPLRLSVDREQVVLAPLSAAQATVQAHEFAAQLDGLKRFDLVFAPLALGDHIDHRIARDAVKIVVAASRLAFYEDLPYAARLSMERRTRESVAACDEVAYGFVRRSTIHVGGGRQAKQRFALCYPSQVMPEVAEEIASYGAGFSEIDGGAGEAWYSDQASAEMLIASIGRPNSASTMDVMSRAR